VVNVAGQFLRFVAVGCNVTASPFAALVRPVELGHGSLGVVTVAAFLAPGNVGYALDGLWTYRMWDNHRPRVPHFLAASRIGLTLSIGVFSTVLSPGVVYLLPRAAARSAWNLEANRRVTLAEQHGG